MNNDKMYNFIISDIERTVMEINRIFAKWNKVKRPEKL